MKYKTFSWQIDYYLTYNQKGLLKILWTLNISKARAVSAFKPTEVLDFDLDLFGFRTLIQVLRVLFFYNT